MRRPKDIPGAKRAHRIRILPTAAQERAFYGFAQVVRWTWNTALRAHNAQVADWKASSEPDNSVDPVYDPEHEIRLDGCIAVVSSNHTNIKMQREAAKEAA